MKQKLFFLFLLLSITSYAQINWGAGIGHNAVSGRGITGQINFDELEFKVENRFEKKVNEMSYAGNYRKCLIYIDKRVQKGKLTSDELNLVYYIKCRLYYRSIYNDWGFRTHRGKSDIDNIIYPYSKSYPINHVDSVIRYSKLLLNATDTSSDIYKSWLGYVYNNLCRAVSEDLDTTLEKMQRSEQYYFNNRKECVGYLEEIQLLKNTIDYFHPINQLGLELMEFRYQHSLGLTQKSDAERIKQKISEYLENRYNWRENRGAALSIPNRMIYQTLYGYSKIEQELHKLLNYLYTSDFVLANQLLKECPNDITNEFAETHNYDTTWAIVENKALSTTRLIDMRETADTNSRSFSIYTTLEISYDIPYEDTIIIDDILVNTYWVEAELVESVELTGKGTRSLTIKTTHPTPPDNEIATIQFSSDDLQLVSNRGLRNVHFKVNAIGRRKE